MNLKKAFTLAEVLITLGIIGIVAAMTMPTLIGSYQKKVLETQYKRSISTLANAVTLMMAKNDVPGDFASVPLMACAEADHACFDREIKKYLPTIINASRDSKPSKAVEVLRFLHYKPNPSFKQIISSIIMPPAYALIDPSYVWNVVYAWGTIFATTDGAYYGLNTLINSETQEEFVNPDTMMVIIDVNGDKNPNKVGEDFFEVAVDKNGMVIDLTCFHNQSCQDESLYDKYGDFSMSRYIISY